MDRHMEEWEDTRTKKQTESLLSLLKVLKLFHGDAVVHGHRDFSNKSCPSFDAKKEYNNI